MIAGLAERLQELRFKNGYSQRQVADRLGLSPSVVSGYETGERTPSAQALLALSYLYRCSTDFLLGRDGSAPTESLDTEGLSPSEISALRVIVEAMKKKD